MFILPDNSKWNLLHLFTHILTKEWSFIQFIQEDLLITITEHRMCIEDSKMEDRYTFTKPKSKM